MARPKVVRNFVTDFRGIDQKYWQDRCMDFVAAANSGDTTADWHLAAIVAGAYGSLGGGGVASRYTEQTRNNLGAFVRAGVCSLRRCRVCRLWFLSFAKRHAVLVLCGREGCRKADAVARADTSRREESKRQREASQQVVQLRTR